MQSLTYSSSADMILKSLRELTGFGPRVPGTINERAARAYCIRTLKKNGFNVKTQSFTVAAFRENSAALCIKKPETKALTARALLRSSPTPNEGIATELVYVGSGRNEDYRGKNVKGKAVLVDALEIESVGVPHVVTLIEIAKKHQARIFIIASRIPGQVITSYGAHRFGTPLPALAITYEDAQFVRQQLRRGPVEINCKLDTSLNSSRSENITAVLPGSEKPQEFICASAHVDSVHLSEGANDNASGVSVLLEMARLLSDSKPKRSILLAIFSAEEGGCIGSCEYVKKNSGLLESFKALINFDMVGVGSKTSIDVESVLYPYGFEPGRTVKPPRWLVNLVTKNTSSLGYRLEHSTCWTCGDEGPFSANGVPAVFWGKIPYTDWYHTERDRIERCDVNSLKSSCDVGTGTILQLANAAT